MGTVLCLSRHGAFRRKCAEKEIVAGDDVGPHLLVMKAIRTPMTTLDGSPSASCVRHDGMHAPHKK